MTCKHQKKEQAESVVFQLWLERSRGGAELTKN